MGKLLGHLARGSQVEAALDLARSLLALRPGARTSSVDDENELSQALVEPQPKFDVWDYQQILKENMPDLVTAAGESALQLMCDILEDAVRISTRVHDQGESQDLTYENYLYIQRPAIEEHSQNEP